MTRSVVEIVLLVLLAAGAAELLLKLFWPRPSHAPDASDIWAQHNELRSPSLEKAAEAGETGVDAALAVQDMGIR